jgi:hypothetical protein
MVAYGGYLLVVGRGGAVVGIGLAVLDQTVTLNGVLWDGRLGRLQDEAASRSPPLLLHLDLCVRVGVEHGWENLPDLAGKFFGFRILAADLVL